MAIIAVIRLAPGQVGYFDELTRIHLTISNPQKEVFSGMNTKNLKRSVKSGRLLLVSGTLDPETNVQQEVSKPVNDTSAVDNKEVKDQKEDAVYGNNMQDINQEEVKQEDIKEEKVETAEEAEEKAVEEVEEKIVEEVEEKVVEEEKVEAEEVENNEEEVKEEESKTTKKSTTKKKSTKK